MKEAWLYSCLINISGQPNKFVLNNRFGKTIIMLNKENINPSANAKFDESLQKTVSCNVLSLWNIKAVLLQAASSTLHSKWYLTISSFPDVCYLIKILANELAFEEQLEWWLAKNVLLDFFVNGTALLARGVSVADYKASLLGNCGSVYSDNNKDNNKNEVDNNVNTIEGQGRNMENSNDVNF